MSTKAGLETVDAIFAQLSATYNSSRDALRIRKEKSRRLVLALQSVGADSGETKLLENALIRYYSPSVHKRYGGQEKVKYMVRKHLARIQKAFGDPNSN